jgi:hypothetical protein
MSARPSGRSAGSTRAAASAHLRQACLSGHPVGRIHRDRRPARRPRRRVPGQLADRPAGLRHRSRRRRLVHRRRDVLLGPAVGGAPGRADIRPFACSGWSVVRLPGHGRGDADQLQHVQRASAPSKPGGLSPPHGMLPHPVPDMIRLPAGLYAGLRSSRRPQGADGGTRPGDRQRIGVTVKIRVPPHQPAGSPWLPEEAPASWRTSSSRAAADLSAHAAAPRARACVLTAALALMASTGMCAAATRSTKWCGARIRDSAVTCYFS